MKSDSLIEDQPRALGGRWTAILGWGAYLGCSWTWCIGMFLPVLLARDFGPWGWAAFAVPNVLGAAAMGFVIRKAPGHMWIAAHGGALTWFMRVTLLFQWFFLGWIAAGINAWWLGLVVLVIGGVWPQPSAQGWRRVALMVWGVSIACAGVYLVTSGESLEASLHRPGLLSANELLWLAPVCAFGFALCPYLDMTFHAARRHMNASESRRAFSLGFLVFFASMLAFTFVYAPLLMDDGPRALASRSIGAIAVAAHMAIQIGFTTFAFYDAFDRLHPRPSAGFKGAELVVLLLIAYLGAYLLTGKQVLGRDASELAYRCFMGFYGLVFPAYVWVCMIPGKRASAASAKTRLLVFWIVIVFAAPCFWMGFIEKQGFWLMPGLGLVILSRLVFLAPARPKYYAPEYEYGYTPTESGAAPARSGAA